LTLIALCVNIQYNIDTKTLTCDEKWLFMTHNVLYSQEEIERQVDALARLIAKDVGESPTILVGLLNGSVVFLSDIMRQLYLYGVKPEVDFMVISSYKDGHTSDGTIEIIQDIRSSVEGKTVIVIDDIADTGLTLYEVKKTLAKRNPAKLLTCVLLDKPSRRKYDVQPDYSAFVIDDVFVVGYGLDSASRFRYLPYIAVLSE
jgi:hypoxanthine phosphoribosyltransferase